MDLDTWLAANAIKTVPPLTTDAADRSLRCAAEKGDVQACLQQLSRGADVNRSDAYGHTPLFFAAWQGHLEVCLTLLTAGARVNASPGFVPAMHACATNGHVAICNLLLDAGADFDAKNENGDTPLHLAAWFNDPFACRSLIGRGADVCAQNRRGVTPLHYGAPFPDVCALLLAECARVHTLNEKGESPLDRAIASLDCSILSCQLLVAYCAPLPTKTATLQTLELAVATDAYVTAIHIGGWQRRLAALRNYVGANGHLRGW